MISRPGRRQGLLYKHLCHSFTDLLIEQSFSLNIFMAPASPNGFKWFFQSWNKLYWHFSRDSKPWRALTLPYWSKSYAGLFSPFCGFQSIFTDIGFHLKSGSKKRLSTQAVVFILNLISRNSYLPWTFLYLSCYFLHKVLRGSCRKFPEVICGRNRCRVICLHFLPFHQSNYHLCSSSPLNRQFPAAPCLDPAQMDIFRTTFSSAPKLQPAAKYREKYSQTPLNRNELLAGEVAIYRLWIGNFPLHPASV